MRAEVIALGDELTTGQRLDTNSQWISRELAVLGIPTAFHTTTTDSLADGVAAFRTAVERADVVVATGGLGPTADDLTRDVLAAVAGEPLTESAEALAAVEARFARRAAPMPESNRRQALFPRSSRVIPNPDGTAPGIDIEIPRAGRGACRVFALPGVPGEMKSMWSAMVAPALVAGRPDAATILFRRIKCFGAGESAIEAMLPDLVRRGREPLVGITAHEATITLRIAARGRDDAACLELVAPTERLIRAALGDLVYGVEDDEIEDAALAALARAGGTLATAEAATCGAAAALLAGAASRGGLDPQRGEPGVFRGGLVLPAAVESATALAERARKELGASHGLGIGPVRAPDGVEAVEIALVGPGGGRTVDHRLGGAGQVRIARAAKTALDLVRTSVQSPPRPGSPQP
ncbi:MAG: competence/damage-inducible protein A [Planctomycetia bacterium]|nr:competence/damage-inducible protein A [Planctomycetia bacterium]